jgi:hypothetical protein
LQSVTVTYPDLCLGKEAGMYRGDEKIAVANGRDLGNAPITSDERAIDRLREIGEGFLAIAPPARP